MERKFDKIFLAVQIIIAQKRLEDHNISNAEKINLENTINKFTEYIERRKTVIIDDEEKTFDKGSYKKLNDKLNKDLELINLNFWEKVLYLHDHLDRSEFIEKNYNYIAMEQENVFNMILNFYQEIDEEYYQKALQIIQCPTSLINFDDNIIIGNECFACETLKAPFINITSVNDDKYAAFVHELQHGIDYLLKGTSTAGLLSELTPMFFESLFIDLLCKDNKCEGLYHYRINATVNNLEWLNSYAKILISFDRYGRKITKYNIKKILDVKSDDELKCKYQKYMKINFINCWRYMLSFLICIKLRNDYYNGQEKEVIKSLKDSVFGKYMDINFSVLINDYNEFVEEIKEKNKGYQKTVNL